MTPRPPQISDEHLSRRAAAYIRQSSEHQVVHNVGSTAVQREVPGLLEAWGWPLEAQDIFEDLGVSASRPDARRGLAELFKRIQAGLIGIVAVTEISRLTRNLRDLVNFIELARRHNVLLAIGQQIIDFRDPNSEFIGLILGANAGRERRSWTDLNSRARRKKAEQGFATTRPPIGYVSLPGGNWDKTENLRIREVIQLIFDKAEELRSGGAVARFLRRNGVSLPRPHIRGIDPWVTATRAKVLRILRNEAYAGMLVYGKTKADPFEHLPSGHAKIIARPPHEWVRVPNHHPAYIPLDRWLALQSNMLPAKRAISPIGRGDAIAQGLLRCTVHNCAFATAYRLERMAGRSAIRIATYRCVGGEDGPACVTVQASVLDPLIERELLATLAPPSLDVIQETVRDALREYEVLLRDRRDALTAAERRVLDLERTLEQFSSGRPHLRRRLVDRLEEAVADYDKLKAEQSLRPLVPPLQLTEEELDRLRVILRDLSRLWRHPAISAEQRKLVARTAIRSIRLTPADDSRLLQIDWVGGTSTALPLPTDRGVRKWVAEQYSFGKSLEEITTGLQALMPVRRIGSLTATPYSLAAVRSLIRRMGLHKPFIQAAARILAERLLDPHTTYAGIASELNAKGVRQYLGRWTDRRVACFVRQLRRGRIPGAEALTPPPSYIDVLRELQASGLSPRQIACELTRRDFRTSRRRPINSSAVYHALRRLGLASNSIAREQRLRALVRDGSLTPKQAAEKANALGLHTRYGNPWTQNGMARKLALLGYRSIQPRPLRRRRSTQGFTEVG